MFSTLRRAGAFSVCVVFAIAPLATVMAQSNASVNVLHWTEPVRFVPGASIDSGLGENLIAGFLGECSENRGFSVRRILRSEYRQSEDMNWTPFAFEDSTCLNSKDGLYLDTTMISRPFRGGSAVIEKYFSIPAIVQGLDGDQLYVNCRFPVPVNESPNFDQSRIEQHAKLDVFDLNNGPEFAFLNVRANVRESYLYLSGILPTFGSIKALKDSGVIREVCESNSSQMDLPLYSISASEKRGNFVITFCPKLNNLIVGLQISMVKDQLDNGTVSRVDTDFSLVPSHSLKDVFEYRRITVYEHSDGRKESFRDYGELRHLVFDAPLPAVNVKIKNGTKIDCVGNSQIELEWQDGGIRRLINDDQFSVIDELKFEYANSENFILRLSTALWCGGLLQIAILVLMYLNNSN